MTANNDQKTAAGNAVKRSDRIIVLLITMIASFLAPFMTSSINVAVPRIGQEFGMNAVALSWVPMSFVLASASILVPLGRLADIVGRRRLFITGMSIISIGSALCAASVSGTMLIACRVFSGIGGSMVFATVLAMVTSAFPPQNRGRVLGINSAAIYLGFSTGPFLGGFLTEHLGWRSIFIASIVFSLSALAGTLFKIKNEAVHAKIKGFDFTGSAIYAAGLFGIIYGLSLIPAPIGGGVLGIGAIAFLVFILWENHAKNPVLHPDLFRHNRVFALSNLAALATYAGTWGTTFLVSLYLQYIKHLTPDVAGLILVITPFVQMISSPIAGKLSDAFEPRVLATVGISIIAIAMVMMIFIPEQSSLYLYFCLFLQGLGFGIFVSPNTNAIMGSIKQGEYGFASAIVATARQMGIMFSMGTVMLLFALLIGQAQINPANYPAFLSSMRLTFIFFAVMSFAAIFASFARGNIHTNDK